MVSNVIFLKGNNKLKITSWYCKPNNKFATGQFVSAIIFNTIVTISKRRKKINCKLKEFIFLQLSITLDINAIILLHLALWKICADKIIARKQKEEEIRGMHAIMFKFSEKTERKLSAIKIFLWLEVKNRRRRHQRIKIFHNIYLSYKIIW